MTRAAEKDPGKDRGQDVRKDPGRDRGQDVRKDPGRNPGRPPGKPSRKSPAPQANPGLERRGRPRNAAIDTDVIEAVLRLLEEGATIGQLSMERIARRAGVGKATLYRRWPGKNELMLEVMRSVDDSGPELEGASVRDDLVACLEAGRRRAVAKRSSALMRNVLAQFQSDPALWRAYHDTTIAGRRAELHEVLRRGVIGGEIRADIDLGLLGDLFMGPMLSRAMLRPDASLEEGLAERIVDAVLAGAGTCEQ